MKLCCFVDHPAYARRPMMDGPARRAKPGESCCTQRWALSAMKRSRSSVECRLLKLKVLSTLSDVAILSQQAPTFSGVTRLFFVPPANISYGPQSTFEPLMPVQIEQSTALHFKMCQCTVYAILTVRLLHYHQIRTCTYFISQQTRNPISATRTIKEIVQRRCTLSAHSLNGDVLLSNSAHRRRSHRAQRGTCPHF